METKINEFRGHFATPSQEASRAGFGGVLDGFGKDFGRVLDGFGNVFGKIFNEFWKGFRLNFRRFPD